jgi:hypothetical protein
LDTLYPIDLHSAHPCFLSPSRDDGAVVLWTFSADGPASYQALPQASRLPRNGNVRVARLPDGRHMALWNEERLTVWETELWTVQQEWALNSSQFPTWRAKLLWQGNEQLLATEAGGPAQALRFTLGGKRAERERMAPVRSSSGALVGSLRDGVLSLTGPDLNIAPMIIRIPNDRTWALRDLALSEDGRYLCADLAAGGMLAVDLRQRTVLSPRDSVDLLPDPGAAKTYASDTF